MSDGLARIIFSRRYQCFIYEIWKSHKDTSTANKEAEEQQDTFFIFNLSIHTSFGVGEIVKVLPSVPKNRSLQKWFSSRFFSSPVNWSKFGSKSTAPLSILSTFSSVFEVEGLWLHSSSPMDSSLSVDVLKKPVD